MKKFKEFVTESESEAEARTVKMIMEAEDVQSTGVVLSSKSDIESWFMEQVSHDD